MSYEGVCHGGPLNGQTIETRYPKGFLLIIDKQVRKCWIYEWDEKTSSYQIRQEEPMDLLDYGQKNRFRAAEEFNYDVVAAPRSHDDN